MTHERALWNHRMSMRHCMIESLQKVVVTSMKHCLHHCTSEACDGCCTIRSIHRCIVQPVHARCIRSVCSTCLMNQTKETLTIWLCHDVHLQYKRNSCSALCIQNVESLSIRRCFGSTMRAHSQCTDWIQIEKQVMLTLPVALALQDCS